VFYFELLVVGLVWGATYAMMALGLTLVYGLLRILHVAHAAVFTLGAYAGVLVANATGSVWLAVPVAMGVAGLFGPVIYLLVYKPILTQPPYVALIASIGLLIAMEDGFRLMFGPYGISFNENPWFITTYSLFGITLNAVQIVMCLAAVILVGAFALFMARTRLGVVWRAIVSDPQIAESFGAEPEKVRLLNFAMGSALAGIAGLLVALLNNLVEPGMGAILSYKGLAIIVLGGLGNVTGALIASVLLGIVESFGSVYLSNFLDRDAIAFFVLIVVLMVRPRGLLAKAD
jgi:branched-chain amino acid transport system permease protein